MNIYDRDGKPMTLEAFAAIPRKKRIVKQKTLILTKEPISVLTMWDGVDNSEGESKVPLPFSTYVHSKSYPNMFMATPSEQHAVLAHEMMCGFVRAQGAKGGWRVPLYLLSRAWSNPGNVKQGWISVALAAFVLLVQLAMLTLSAVTWDWDWVDLLPAFFAVLYSYWLAGALKGLKRKLRERDEERRVEKEKTEFENIIGPLR